jgi:TRAP-type C4-dicarboxylate transport system substrate-binding protein
MKKALICLALGAVILGAPCAPAQAPPTEALTKPTTFEPVELRFAVYAPPTHPLVKSLLEPWTQRVAERTEGRVTVAIYGGQSLCKATETADAVASGIADAGFGFLEYHPGRFPLTDVTGLPFL